MSVSALASSARLRRVALLASTALVAASAAQAQASWTGATSTDWATATNWSTGAVPVAATTVTVNTETPNSTVVSTAGQVANSITLGSAVGQSGALTVTGAGRLNQGPAAGFFACCFLVGDFGTGEVTVEAGGILTTGLASVGNNATGVGAVTVTGAGSQWIVNNASLDVGSSGQGTLDVLDGGVVRLNHPAVNVGLLTIGNDAVAAAHGRVFVSGAGSQFVASAASIGFTAPTSGEVQVSNGGLFAGGATTIGSAGDGEMIVDTGGDATATSLTLAAGAGSTGVATVTGAGSTYAASQTLTVGSAGAGELLVEAGGVVTSNAGSISAAAGGSGVVTVTGANSRWTITNQLQAGTGAAADIDVLAGGTLAAGSFLAGNAPQITVGGANSLFSVTNSMTMGSTTAGGLLDILAGGRVSAGSFTGSNSLTVNVTGAAAQFAVTNGFALGQTGAANSLDVLAGGTLTTGQANLTTVAGTSVAAVVDGAGSSWTATNLLLGGAGTSTLSVSNGGEVDITVGATSLLNLRVDGTGDARLTISSGGSVVQGDSVANAGSLYIGEFADGELLIESGGSLSSRFSLIGAEAGSTGSATVTGAGSLWRARGSLGVAFDGAGALDIVNGGQVIAESGVDIGFSPGSIGVVTVSGPGSRLTAPEPPALSGVGNISVGLGGDGTLIVENGAVVDAQGIGVGSSIWDIAGGGGILPGVGYFRATGPTTRINLNVASFQSFDVGGDDGVGVADILDGAQVTVVGLGAIGDGAIFNTIQTRGVGTLNIDGAGSSVTYTRTFDVGAHGEGTVNITAGGFLSNSDGYIGSWQNSDGTFGLGRVTVSGAGSTWTNTGFLRVGDLADGTLNVLAGAAVNSSAGDIGRGSAAIGRALVSGAGSAWTNAGNLGIGRAGQGRLTLTDGGTVSVGGLAGTGTLRIAELATGNGVLNIGAAAADPAAAAGTLNAATVAFGLGTGAINFNHTNANYLFASAITGGGAINHLAGTTTLSGVSSHTGATTVSGGLLRVTGSLASATVGVGAGASLTGTGTLSGTTSIANGGNLVGAAGGLLTLGALTLADTSNLNLTLGAPSNTALFNVTGALTLDGRLNVTDGGGFVLGTYRLFDYGGALTNNGLVINTLPAGSNPGDWDIDVATAGQVNLVVDLGPGEQFWDGPNLAPGGVADGRGGTGVWNAANTNWTNAAGSINAPWAGEIGVFAGSAGAVTVQGVQAFLGLRFATSGYDLVAGAGGALSMSDPATAIEVTGGQARIAAPLQGTGGLVKQGAGTLVLAGSNSFAGGTVVATGVLEIEATGALAAGPVRVAPAGGPPTTTLRFTDWASAGGLAITNNAITEFVENSSAGAAAITNAPADPTGVATPNGPALLAFRDAASAGTATIVNAGGIGALTATTTFSGAATAGAATITNQASGFTEFSGAANGASARIFTQAGGETRFLGSANAGSATLANDGGRILFGGSASGGSAVIANNAGSLEFFATASAGGARVSNLAGAVVDISGTTNGAAIGSLSGTGGVTLGDRVLTVGGLGDDDLIAGAITGGAGGLTKVGAGVLTLSGASAYDGATTVSAGMLEVDGQLDGSRVTVANGAILTGRGAIGVGADILDGGVLRGATGDLLTLGELDLAAAANLDLTLGAPSAIALFDIAGDLKLDGRLHVTAGAGFGLGAYRLFDYGGALTDGGLVITTVPAGYNPGDWLVDVATGGQVNLLVQAGSGDQYWDGPNFAPGGVVNGRGGSGVWNAANTNWTNGPGNINAPWARNRATFAGAAGTVTVVGRQTFQGLRFLTGGYHLVAGADGALATGQAMAELEIGAGSARIDTPISGAGGLVKLGAGEIVLGGVNSYAGATQIAAGRLVAAVTGALSDGPIGVAAGGGLDLAGVFDADGLRIASGGLVRLGDTSTAAGAVIENLAGGQVDISGHAAPGAAIGALFGAGRVELGGRRLTLGGLGGDDVISGRIAGAGGLTKVGAGQLTLSGPNTFTGLTQVRGGVLRVTGTMPGDITVETGARLNGRGSIGGDVRVLDGGALEGRLNDRLRIGSLTLESGALMLAHLGAPSATGLFAVDGDLALNGRLLVSDAGGFGLGSYRLVDYGGGLSGAGLTIVSLPAGFNPGDWEIDTATAGQVNLVVAEGDGTQYWDGPHMSPGQVANGRGGSGVWNAANTNWTNASGTINAPWAGETAVFAGAAGVVQVQGLLDFEALRFLTGGYRLTGGAGAGLRTSGPAPIEVGGGLSAEIAAAIGGAGGIAKTGAGRLVLSGANTYGGATTVQAGTLRVTGQVASPAVSVLSGATLDGTGSLTGAVSVAAGGRLAPGAGGAGTIRLGALTLASGAILDFDLGPAGVVGGANDLIQVAGDVTLDGVLNVTDVGGFGLGVYRLIDYGGDLTDQGLQLGALPAGVDPARLVVQTAVDHQVNLVFSGPDDPGPGPTPEVQFWDGAQTVADGAIAGGAGVWNTASTNWTRANGEVNDAWGGRFAVFQGAAGVVSVAEPVSFTGLQFMTGGYRVEGAGLTATAAQTVIRVDPGVTAEIASAIGGAGGLVKHDAGTLRLTGANSYAGGTQVLGGTLVGSAASLQGNILNNATLAFDQAAAGTYAGVLSGTGALNKLAAGTLTLTGASGGYAGQTSVSAGVLQVEGVLGGTISVGAGGRLQGNGQVGSTTVAGTIAPGASIGALTVNGSYTHLAGSTYVVDIDPAGRSDLIDVTGAASLQGGTVQVEKLPGTYAPGLRYTILTAGGGVSGTFAGLQQNLPLVDLALAYGANAVHLDVVRNEVPFPAVGETRNQQAGGLGAESLGEDSPIYERVLLLDAPAVRAAFDSLSGELHASLRRTLLDDGRYLRAGIGERLRAAGEADGRAAWAQVFGARGEVDSDGNAAALDRDIDGVFLGGDLAVGAAARLGFATGYSRTQADVDARRSNAEATSYHLAGYLGAGAGAWRLHLGAGYSWHDIETVRGVAFSGFSDTARAAYDGSTAQLFGEAAYAIPAGRATLEPFAALAHVVAKTDGFIEEGGPAALTGERESDRFTVATLGVRPSVTFEAGGGAQVRLQGGLAWRYAFDEVLAESTLRFASGGAAFSPSAAPIGRSALALEARAEVQLSPRAAISFDYTGQIADEAHDHAVKAAFHLRF